MLAWIGNETPIWVIVTILIWVGLGFALFSSPNMSTIMGSVERRQYGQASGLAASMRVFGQIISMSVVTLLFTLHFGDLSVDAVEPKTFIRTMHRGFIIFALIGIPGYTSHTTEVICIVSHDNLALKFLLCILQTFSASYLMRFYHK